MFLRLGNPSLDWVGYHLRTLWTLSWGSGPWWGIGVREGRGIHVLCCSTAILPLPGGGAQSKCSKQTGSVLGRSKTDVIPDQWACIWNCSLGLGFPGGWVGVCCSLGLGFPGVCVCVCVCACACACVCVRACTFRCPSSLGSPPALGKQDCSSCSSTWGLPRRSWVSVQVFGSTKCAGVLDFLTESTGRWRSSLSPAKIAHSFFFFLNFLLLF